MVAFTSPSEWVPSKGSSIKFSGKGVDGIFKKFNTNIFFDETNFAGSKISISIEVSSLNTGNALQNKHATGAEWFDAAIYPQIKFATSAIEKNGNSYTAKGKMQVKNKTKDMSIPFVFNKAGNAGTFSSKFVIKRSDFDIGEPNDDVSNDITVELTVPVIQTSVLKKK